MSHGPEVVAHFIDAALDREIAFTSLRYQVGAVSAADAYHRISGRLGTATVKHGPRFTNRITALRYAQRGRDRASPGC
jgi:acetolactate synthase-1/2/3 large subunit